MKNTELIMDNGKLRMTDWEEKKLGDILNIARGGSPRPISKYLTDEINGINWIKISDGTNSDRYIYETKQKITKDGLHKTRLVEEGDFILSNSMSFGRPYIMKTTGAIHDGWLVLKEKNEKFFNKEFLYYLLSSSFVYNQFQRLAAGTTVKNLNIRLVSQVKVPLPPLPEQRRIVSKLDALFAEIDASLALIDQNIKQAEALKLSVLDEEFSAIRKQDNIFKIKDVAYTKSGATPRRSNKSYWNNGDIPWLKSGELSDNKNITENSEFITQKGLENSSTKLFPKGTLLMAMYGATAGKLGILGMEACTNQAVCSIQNNKDLFVEEYLYYFLLMIREQIILDSFGGAQPNISKRYIDNLEVPFPQTKETQQKIVQKLDSLFAEIDGLVKDCTQKRENLEALKSSLLDRAFRGEL